MLNLHDILHQKTLEWEKANWQNEEYPEISEILEWAKNPDGSGFKLRPPQFLALQVYWYLRIIEGTPHIKDLYQHLIPRKSDLVKSLGIAQDAFAEVDYDIDALWEKIKDADDFVITYKLQGLRETLCLDYPSYILALAMGAGKTILIGAIYATEFAMSQEYPNRKFVENALIFAPGKTIIESLRELAEMHYEAILPPRFYKQFAAQLKLTFTRDGDPEIPIIPGSQFNVVVTNTEKIRIQKETIRKADMGKMFSQKSEDEARTEIANLRLQRIASLPNLAIFSDEAHHTYGQAMDKELKKVRKTVDYLHNPHTDSKKREQHETNLICVVNTTGTPYYQKQALRDVVVWYGLSEGIRDGILKELSGNIKAFDFEGNVQPYLEYVVEDFFRQYGDVKLPDGVPAKLAIFFPQTADVEEFRWIVEKKLVEMSYSTDLILEHHTNHEEKDEYDRFRTSPKRVALLVSRGVEGWNVPALFACALARRLQSGGNNFVLQAASRCLRQIPGNTHPARIYLSMDNRTILDNQLQESYGESIRDLNEAQTRSMHATITLRKVNLPPLVIKQKVRSVVQKVRAISELSLAPVKCEIRKTLRMITFTLARQLSSGKVLQEAGEGDEIQAEVEMIDLFSAAVELADNYHQKPMAVYQGLKRIYETEEIPLVHLDGLAEQIEKQTSAYEIIEEMVELALALIKPENFHPEIINGVETYTAEIQFPIDRQPLLTSYNEWKVKADPFGFHYDPYNFDSRPEKNFFEQMLNHLKVHTEEVDDIYFTGAISDPQKTDFYVDYFGEDGRWHRYSPDFLIRRKDGKCLIVEIKREDKRKDLTDGENGRKAMAVKKWIDLNPGLLKYEMIFTREEHIAFDQLKAAKDFVK